MKKINWAKRERVGVTIYLPHATWAMWVDMIKPELFRQHKDSCMVITRNRVQDVVEKSCQRGGCTYSTIRRSFLEDVLYEGTVENFFRCRGQEV